MKRAFENQTALVTGAGRGIGRACALALAQEGCRVALASRTLVELESTARTIRDSGGEALVVPLDVSSESQVVGAFALIRATWGSVDVLINSAAIFSRALLGEHSVADWDAVMGINVTGTFLCSREVFRDRALTKKPASIVNISSLAGIRGTEKFPGLSSYVASKFAVTGMTEAFAVEGKAIDVRVNGIAPGAVDTEMLRKAVPHLKTDTTPEMIAKTVLNLADRNATGHITGSIIEIYSNLS